MKFSAHLYSINILWMLSGLTYTIQLDTESYKSALKLSLLFYEAQRSGHLPETNRIPWRGDSAVNDKGQNGEDLSGGYYDGSSDYVKFSFTIAFTTTMLSWGVISYEKGYKAAGQYEIILDTIKWATDYFIKCHVSRNEFYGQVGDFALDTNFWGRPEDMNMSRPTYKIDEKQPGSDLAGEVAAAFAASSIVFKDVNQTYSEILLTHATDMFNFANTYRGLYQEVIPGAKAFYENAGYGQELTWASIWLYKATNNKTYLTKAISFYETFRLKERPNEFYYNKKVAGIQILLANATEENVYITAVDAFCDYSMKEQTRTPKGLIFIEKLGTLSHAANIAFICLEATKLGLNPEYVQFVKDQIDYMLGKNGRNFVVGFGRNSPKRPYHAASSCPDRPQPCNWKYLPSSEPNPQTLFGALVSGPNRNDHYEDIREEYMYSEVTLDYNAGFQSTLAGLIQNSLENNNR